ncbi:MAG TPA: L-threonylcarbamoyladenylate synthase [Anaerolineaceae bacterium]|jgi:L-threonylcarbamoyladenylate synthase|nr:L-threonylcarbamoyladenylate synthase [Anaerolineaceae bacterium]HPT23815.1 L-threonylcarbamoyladenylate synthase [Anaerolineaceae bacterium]
MSEMENVLDATDPQALIMAQRVAANGGVIVFPTDTLYGMACDPRNPEALARVYDIKGRSAQKALPVLVGGLDQLVEIVSEVPEKARRLLETFWPGPLTIVLPKQPGLPAELTPYPGVAVRMPNHPFALALLQAFGPLAVTSANLSDHANPGTAEEVLAQLGNSVDLVIDGGRLEIGRGSTILDCGSETLVLLREGPISFETLMEAWNQ